ncbi:MAG TPA: S8 family serine peptidase [Gammaproteobacteria bacterium]
MRSLSLGIFAVISVSAALGLARAAHVGEPMHPVLRSLAAHRIDPAARRVASAADGDFAYYIVRMKDSPVATYAGGIPGFAATNPRINGRTTLDIERSASYTAYLDERRSELLDSARQALGRTLIPRFEYRYAFNGMSVKLNRTEALRLAMLPGVAAVEPVRHFKPDTSVAMPASPSDTNSSRTWINAPTVWTVASNGTDNEGEGIVVADLDTGINDQNSSFAATGPLDGYVAKDPGARRFGVCDLSNAAQRQFVTPLFCNAKLIGAYTYTGDTGNDPNSPEDSEGHGSHTASTMVGDFVNDVTIPGAGANSPLSGVAPHASIIAYDVCDPTDLCSTDASVAAVEQAIDDQATLAEVWGSKFKGMVLNFSIGGSDDAYDDPVEQAFLAATEAGIYVSAAGGNGGPENVIENDPAHFPLYAVQHTGPWVATIGAATHDGTFSSNTLENFSGGTGTPTHSMIGIGITDGVGPETIVYASNFAGHDPAMSGNEPTSGAPYPTSQGSTTDAQACIYPFRAGTFTNSDIVVCDRDLTTALVDKAYNVQAGGAGGVVIASTSTSNQDMVAEPYVIPGTLLDETDGKTLRKWLKANVGTALSAQISGSTLTTDPTQADQLAGFSSRGPTSTIYDNLVKPDLAAPGVAVLAALSDPQYTEACSRCAANHETYGFMDGTSMATPHDTGAAALLMQAHPSWTPAEIKSALMLTAVTDANGTSPGLKDQCGNLDSSENCVFTSGLPSPQVRGAGRIDVDAANRTGLVLDETGADYTAANPEDGGDLTTLNLASLASDDCAETCVWKRTFTSPFKNATVHITLSSSDLSTGMSMHFSPSSFVLAPGASTTVTFTADDASVTHGKWVFAQVDLSAGHDTGDGGAAIPDMHMPVAVLSEPPQAHMQINSTALAFGTLSSTSATQNFTISNGGQSVLDWTVSSNGGVLQSNSAAATAEPVQSGGAIWTQPATSKLEGFPSTFFTQSNHGIYSADTFIVSVNAHINGIVASGFAQDSSSAVPINGKVDWYIYTDASGQPAGNPEDGINDYKWHYSGNAGDPGIDTTSGVITLDLTAAGQPSVNLSPGNYWLIVVPSLDGREADSNAPTWFWFEGVSPDKATSGMIDDPSGASGHGIGWESLGTSFEFTLNGSLDCGNGSMPGLSISPGSGSVKAGGSQSVKVTMSAASLAAGTYQGAVCVAGNASDHPTIALAVSATVLASSGSSSGGSSSSGGGSSGSGGGSTSSGGGGGGLSLLDIMLLGFLARRRQMN